MVLSKLFVKKKVDQIFFGRFFSGMKVSSYFLGGSEECESDPSKIEACFKE